MTAFELSETLIDPAALRVRLARPEAGAFAVFEGWVRNEHRGREVRRLEYEVFPEMARTEGQAIVEEAAARFPGCEVLCVHRCGVAEVGELAVWIGATAGHRAAAFAACRLVIEEIKRRLPVWKKEHFAGAEPEWVDCTQEHNPALRREEFHSRQARLSEFGPDAPARLAAANVLVVGAGGLGCVAADTLAAAGVGRLTVIDPGLVELSNLPRQSLYTAEDLGLAKAVAAEVRLRARNPFIAIEGVVGALQETNAQARIAGRTLVLDCTDQFAARFLLHDVCRALGVPLVQAAAIGWDGSVNTFGAAGATSGCLHCLWPGRSPGELAAAGDCNGGAVFGPAVNALGLMQATEAIKLLAGLPVASATQTLLVSWLDYSTLAVPRVAQPGCPVCDTAAGAARAAAASPVAEAGLFVSVAELERRGVAWQVLSLEVAPPSAALARRPVVAAAGMPWAELRAAAARRPTLVVCAHGVRSAAVVRELRAEGVATVFALAPEVFP